MKRFGLLSGIVAMSLALTACGSSPAARKASLNAYVASLGASSNLQIALTGSYSGPNAAKVNPILSKLSFNMAFSDASGGPLSQARAANVEMSVTAGGSTLFSVRQIANNVYVKANFDGLKQFAGVPLSSTQLAGAQLVFGGRWFELPGSLLQTLMPHKKVNSANVARERLLATKVVDALTNLIDTTPYKNLGGGTYSVQGTLNSAATAIAAALNSAGQTVPAPHGAKGTYVLTISTSNSVATGASLSITGPTGNGAHGDTTVGLSATFTHNNSAVRAPAGATVLSAALLKGLFGVASFSRSTSSGWSSPTVVPIPVHR